MRSKPMAVFLFTALVVAIARAQAPAPAAPQVPPAGQSAPTTTVAGAAAAAAGGAPTQDPNVPTIQGGDAGASNFLTPFDYDPRGRRDPFQPPTDEKPVEQGTLHGPFLPLQRFDLTQIKLSAIIWDVSHPKAMLADPDGKVYIVGPNTKIGKNNGYIAVIREGELVIIETTEENGRLMSSTRILRLATPATK